MEEVGNDADAVEGVETHAEGVEQGAGRADITVGAHLGNDSDPVEGVETCTTVDCGVGSARTSRVTAVGTKPHPDRNAGVDPAESVETHTEGVDRGVGRAGTG